MIKSETCDEFLKSGTLQQFFSVKIQSVGNLIKMLEEFVSGNNAVIDIHQYKYLDTMYEMKYGYDLVLDTTSAKMEKRQRQETEINDKKKEHEMLLSVQETQKQCMTIAQLSMDKNQFKEYC